MRESVFKMSSLGSFSRRQIEFVIYFYLFIYFIFFFFFFITKKTGFDISCNGDNLHEMQILFSWKNKKNISKCHLLKIVPRVLIVKVCTNKSRTSLCMAKPTMAKPTIKLVPRDGSACTL